MGHLEALYLIFHFMLNKPQEILVMDPSILNVEKSVFNINAGWKEFYKEFIEWDPHQMPEY